MGSFGIGGDLALQAMYTLSGGQKSRVAFAKVTFSKPHILLLDEPSNHLDLDAVNALVQVWLSIDKAVELPCKCTVTAASNLEAAHNLPTVSYSNLKGSFVCIHNTTHLNTSS